MTPNHSAVAGSASGYDLCDGDHHDTQLRKSQLSRSVDPMDPTIDRLRQVIETSGKSQGAFAAAVGLDPPKLSKVLSGARRLTSLDVARIADVGQVSVDWLLSGQELTMATAARRAAGSSSVSAVEIATRFTELRETATDLGWPLAAVEVSIDLSGLTARSAGQKLADAALSVLGDPLLVIDGDVAGLIESHFGIDVAISDLGSDFDGLSALAECGSLILLTQTPVAVRQRFTAAHELAHVLNRDDQGVHLDEDIYAPVGKDASEVCANAFAAAFLMPAELLRDRVKPGFDEAAFAGLAMDFCVSPRALAIRLSSLNLIDKMAEAAFGKLTATQVARLSGRSAELAERGLLSNTRRSPKALAKDLFAAYTAGETTLRPYAAVLGADPAQLRDSLENAGGA